MTLRASYKKRNEIFLASLKSMKKRADPELDPDPGSRSIIQRYGSGDPDLDLHQNVTDPQH
jgi:hypothetical protein